MANNVSKNVREQIDEVALAREKRAAKARAAQSRGAEYDRSELLEAHRKIDDLRKAPLSDRKEAQTEFFEAMRDHPEIVGERISWLLDGSYGHGQMLLAKQVLDNPRMNRIAVLTHMIGAFEWQSPGDMSRAAWKKLSAAEKAALEHEVQAAIKGAQGKE